MKNGDKAVLTVEKGRIELNVVKGKTIVGKESIVSGRYFGKIIPSPVDGISRNNPDAHPERLWISLDRGNGEVIGAPLVFLYAKKGVSIRKTKK